MYNTLYELKPFNYTIYPFTCVEALFFYALMAFMIGCTLEVRKQKKIARENGIDTKTLKKDREFRELVLNRNVGILLAIIAIIVAKGIFTSTILCSNYLYEQYKEGNYRVVEGQVSNLDEEELDYFEVNGVKFNAWSSNILQYNVEIKGKAVVRENGQTLRITYRNCEDYKPENAIVKDDLDIYFSETDNAIIKIEEVKSK